MKTEILQRADFSEIRYAQCWEDADVLLDALDLKTNHVCLSIASAGDNTMALLSRAPEQMIALDLSFAQLACLHLRVAAYQELEHHEMLEFIGSRESRRRPELYRRCRKLLSPATRIFWDSHSDEITQGFGGAGKFERYLAIFRNYVLPLIHSQPSVEELLRDKTEPEREEFYETIWNTRRWRAFFKVFFSRLVMGRLGRDPQFFKYVEGSVAERILARTEVAATQLNPAENPYLQWILTGHHTIALPYALRFENFDAIRANLDRLEIRQQSLEEFLAESQSYVVDRFNLSNIFEYVSLTSYHQLLGELVRVSRHNARMMYWNLFAERRRPPSMAGEIKPLANLSTKLFKQDKAFFYQSIVIEEVVHDEFNDWNVNRPHRVLRNARNAQKSSMQIES
jgi:S-adenosylmethionine-diacylglycerol 3-amino-3-carboxypropyl transferase